jgi:hypothetical protein
MPKPRRHGAKKRTPSEPGRKTLPRGKSPALDLRRLAKGIPGITDEFGACLGQAAAVCLESQRHRVGVTLAVAGTFEGQFSLSWGVTDERTRRCWNDHEVATEHGAYAIAFLLIHRFTKLTVLQRSRKGPGFDYWIGPAKRRRDDLPFQGAERLEVSGIRSGDDDAIERRVRIKLRQVARSSGLAASLPAHVTVVEFSRPVARTVRRSHSLGPTARRA